MRLLSPDEVRGVQLFYPGGYNWRGTEGASRPRPHPVIPDREQQLYVLRAGYGPPAPPRLPRGWQAEALVETAAADAEGGGGRGGRGAKRPRGRPSAAQQGDGEEGGLEGSSVWVLMGWRCGVVRFMRLSME